MSKAQTCADACWNRRQRTHRDDGRLRSSELIYTGAKRTPLCALMDHESMAEFFATTEDCYVLLGKLPEKPNARETADGRPMTQAYAHYRIARMIAA